MCPPNGIAEFKPEYEAAFKLSFMSTKNAPLCLTGKPIRAYHGLQAAEVSTELDVKVRAKADLRCATDTAP